MSFASRYLSEVQSGKGLIGAVAPAAKKGMKDLSKKVSREEIIREIFAGEDILATYIRSKFGVGKKEKKEKETSASPTKVGDDTVSGGISQQGLSFLKIIARSSLSIPGIARDMNVLRQNIQKLVKIKGGEASTGADAFFLKQGEREAALEAQTGSDKSSKEEKEKDEGKSGSFFGNIIKTFATNFLSVLKVIFAPKNLLKFLTKAGPIALIGAAIFSVFKGWKKVFETGSFKEGMIETWGTFLNLLTFGLLGPDTVRDVFDKLESFFKPLTDAVTSLFDGLKSFVKNTFGRFIKFDDTPTSALAPLNIDLGTAAPGGEPTIPFSSDPDMNKAMVDEVANLVKEEQENASKSPTRKGRGRSTSQKTSLVERHTKLASKFTKGSEDSPEGISKEIQFVQYKKEHFEHVRDKLIADGKNTQAAEVSQVVNIYEKRVSELMHLKSEKERQQTTPSQVAAEPPAPSAASTTSTSESSGTAPGAAGSPSESSGADTGTAEAATPAASPSAESVIPPSTGANMAEASTEIAEAQRMESSADMGTVVDTSVTNNTSGQVGNTPKNTTSAYNEVLVNYLAA
jgi:hypothetical protein